VRRLAIALSAALLAAGALAPPVGGGSSTVKAKPAAAKAVNAKGKVRCMGFEF
jgi:hypothetical protein